MASMFGSFLKNRKASSGQNTADTPDQPSLDDVTIPAGTVGGNSEAYSITWVQHVWMWRFVFASMALNVALVALNVLQVAKYKPVPVLVDATTQKPFVIQAGTNEVKVGPTSYDPVQVRTLATNYILKRFQYNPATLQADLEEALTYMTEDAAKRELQVIEGVDWKLAIVQPLARYVVRLDDNSWRIQHAANGMLEVSVASWVTITNATVYRERPFEKQVQFVLRIRRGETTTRNPLGYFVVDGGKDIL